MWIEDHTAGGRYECTRIVYEYKGWPAENKQKGESHEMKMGVRWSDDLCLTSIFSCLLRRPMSLIGRLRNSDDVLYVEKKRPLNPTSLLAFPSSKAEF